jgi:serine/threonine-protein kinase
MTVKVVVPSLETEPSSAARGPLRAQSPKKLPAPVEAERGATQRTIAWIVGGAGVAGLAVGTYFGLRAEATHSELADGPCRSGACLSSATGQLDTFRAQSTAATVFFTVGAAAVIGGLVTYFTAPPGKPADERPSFRVAPTAGPGLAGLAAVGQF